MGNVLHIEPSKKCTSYRRLEGALPMGKDAQFEFGYLEPHRVLVMFHGRQFIVISLSHSSCHSQELIHASENMLAKRTSKTKIHRIDVVFSCNT
jgi:hypothetical protein